MHCKSFFPPQTTTQIISTICNASPETHWHMFWNLFTIRGQALVVWNDEQGGLFHSAGPHRQQRKNSGAVLEKNAGEWTGRVEISREEIPGSRHSMHGYVRTCSRLKSKNLWALGSQQMGIWLLCPQYPTSDLSSQSFDMAIIIMIMIIIIMCSFLCPFSFGAQGPLHETK